MIRIRKATEADTEVLALLGRVTWFESHGHYIEDKNEALHYLNENYSIATTRQSLNNANKQFYIIYVDDLPAGYAKIELDKTNENIASPNNCKLERIYILGNFLPLKLGKQLLTFVENDAKKMKLDTMWLTVYIKNTRGIRFYEKNDFENVGELNFLVSGKEYENIIFSKKL